MTVSQTPTPKRADPRATPKQSPLPSPVGGLPKLTISSPEVSTPTSDAGSTMGFIPIALGSPTPNPRFEEYMSYADSPTNASFLGSREQTPVAGDGPLESEEQTPVSEHGEGENILDNGRAIIAELEHVVRRLEQYALEGVDMAVNLQLESSGVVTPKEMVIKLAQSAFEHKLMQVLGKKERKFRVKSIVMDDEVEE